MSLGHNYIVTARIRRMGEGNVLTRVYNRIKGQMVGRRKLAYRNTPARLMLAPHTRVTSVHPSTSVHLSTGGRGGSVLSPARGGRSKVNPAGGGGGEGQRSIQPGGGGVRSSWGGGGGVISILRPLAGGMPLAFTQEDFLVCGYFYKFDS